VHRKVKGLANALNIRHLKTSSLHHSSKFKVWFGAIERMHDPLYPLQSTSFGKSVRERGKCG